MAVPVPIFIQTAPFPASWKGQNFADLVSLVASLLSGTMDVSLLTGQVGGAQPTTNIGPWLNGDQWWFWDANINPFTGQAFGYQPSEQGCPVGTVAMHGARNGPNPTAPPAGWLLCDGSELQRVTYARLYAAIGTTWGSKGPNSFALPPPGLFYINGYGFAADPHVPNSVRHGHHVNALGGAQTNMITPASLPTMEVVIPFLNPSIIDLGGIDATNPQQGVSPQGFVYRVSDGAGNLFGVNQQPISTMPPFAAITYVIKYL